MDFTSYLPEELVEQIFSYFLPRDLSLVSQCSHTLRYHSNKDNLWLHYCLARGWLKYGISSNLLNEQTGLYASLTNVSGTSPIFPYKEPTVESLRPINKWKHVYIRAHHLHLNWRKGRYSVAPTFRGHSDKVNAFDCNGNIIVSGGEDCTLRVWDMENCQCIHKIDTKQDPVTALKIKGNVVVAGLSGGDMLVFNTADMHKITSYQGNHSSVDHLAFDGRTIISVGADRAIIVWELSTGELKHTLRGHSDDIECFAVHGCRIATGSYDNTIMIWDTETGNCLQTFEGHLEVINGLQFDQNKVVSASSDSTLRIWTIKDGQCQFVLRGHEDEVFCVVYNKHVIASGGTDSRVILWDHSGVCLKVFNSEIGGHIGAIRCMYIDDDKLISAGDRKKIIIWDWKEQRILNCVHRNPNLLYKMWVGETKLITASPGKLGLLTMLSYW